MAAWAHAWARAWGCVAARTRACTCAQRPLTSARAPPPPPAPAPARSYARRSKDQRRTFETFTRAYFKQRSTLAMVLLLVDASIPPQPVDLDYAAWLATTGVPFSLVFTKADKRKKGGPRCGENVAAFKRALLEAKGFPLVPPSIVTSAATGGGKSELLAFVGALRVMWEGGAKR